MSGFLLDKGKAMRQETIQIFRFEELSEDAKEKARQWYRGIAEYHWMDESRESIERFCEEFGIKLRDWEVSTYRPFNYSTNAENRHFRGRKLREFSRDYMPTGYCLDCSLWITFYDEFKRTGDAKAAFDLALYQGFRDWCNDLEAQEGDEYIDDHIIANGYEFTEDGERY